MKHHIPCEQGRTSPTYSPGCVKKKKRLLGIGENSKIQCFRDLKKKNVSPIRLLSAVYVYAHHQVRAYIDRHEFCMKKKGS
jgi:hypothetical protein